MELKSHLSCGFISVFLFLSICCLSAEARPIDQPDSESSQNQTKLSDTRGRFLNVSAGNSTSLNPTMTQYLTKQFVVALPNITGKFKQKEIISVTIIAEVNNTVVEVRIPTINNIMTYQVEMNQVIKLNFTSAIMQSSFDDSSNTIRTQETNYDTAYKIQETQSKQLQQYRSATIILAVLCALMFLALSFLTLRRRAARSTSKKPEEVAFEVVKQAVESEYQSIRGLPRRETGNSYGYETVKPRLPQPRSTINYLIQSNENEYENLKANVRESDVYVPMDEALVASTLTGSTAVLSDENEDLYLTMKKLIRTPEDEADNITCELTNI
ncbi:uncharacterized protein LOC114518942 [Dendronephthya gigantea]|uniref:uncharacterized protein LOC114518942 n=1 Tax=Dendronephthya gigantea TaxID=151771 RepID=UPI00106D9AAE|nr:uncharacterized protein LOC114518942 [Dendronephthya gigantea]